jgi:hypothetical protein
MARRTNYLIILITCFSIGTLNIGIITPAYAEQQTTREQPHTSPDNIYGKVTDILNVPTYTYAEVDTGKMKVWALQQRCR